MDLQLHKFANVVTVFTTAAGPHDPLEFLVVWRSGLNHQGKVSVRVTADVNDKKAVAEMAAMQHVIEVQEVIGKEPPVKGLQLVFSVPVIRKLAANKSEKKHLYPYAYFLTTRFSAAEIAIEQTADWVKPRADQNLASIEVSEPPGEFIGTQRFGKVCVTKHLMDQFCKRMNNIEPVDAFKLLTRLLNETEVEQQTGVDGKDDSGRKLLAKLYHRQSKWCFVIVENWWGRPAIATAYVRM